MCFDGADEENKGQKTPEEKSEAYGNKDRRKSQTLRKFDDV